MQGRKSIDVCSVDIRAATQQPCHFLGVPTRAGGQKDALVVKLDGRQLAIARRSARTVRLGTVPAPQLVFATPQRVFRLHQLVHGSRQRRPAAHTFAVQLPMKLVRNSQRCNRHKTSKNTPENLVQTSTTSLRLLLPFTNCLHSDMGCLKSTPTGTCSTRYREMWYLCNQTTRVPDTLHFLL